VSVLIALIKTNDQKLQKYGLGGLKRLVYNSRESTLAFQKEGGLPPLIALLDSDDVSVLKNAVHALNRVRHYIGREPIEQLGGLAGMGRLLTCPHEKIRILARRNLQSMDEDLTGWIRRIERISLQMLCAARVLLNPNFLVDPTAVTPAVVATPEPLKRKMSFKTLRSSRDPARRQEDTAAVVRPVLAAVIPEGKYQTNLEALRGLPGLDAEKAHILSVLGFGETYWHLRPGTPHFLPLPLLEIIISDLDEDFLLSKSQRRAIFAWARDTSNLGRPLQEFLTSITNNAVSIQPPSLSDSDKSKSCIIS
jgi:hypothetical protein